MDMPEEISVMGRKGTPQPQRWWSDITLAHGTKYTLTSSITAKLEAAEKIFETLKHAQRHIQHAPIGNILQYGCLRERMKETLAHWQRVNGEKT